MLRVCIEITVNRARGELIKREFYSCIIRETFLKIKRDLSITLNRIPSGLPLLVCLLAAPPSLTQIPLDFPCIRKYPSLPLTLPIHQNNFLPFKKKVCGGGLDR